MKCVYNFSIKVLSIASIVNYRRKIFPVHDQIKLQAQFYFSNASDICESFHRMLLSTLSIFGQDGRQGRNFEFQTKECDIANIFSESKTAGIEITEKRISRDAHDVKVHIQPYAKQRNERENSSRRSENSRPD